jgi:hypothetical protein
MSVEELTVSPEDGETTHPAFAQVVASRVSGTTALYGSDFLHHNYMTISVRRSSLKRDLSQDWHYADRELIEIKLSEAQWATFVSAPNVGQGVPCTLNYIDQVKVPDLPDPMSRSDQFIKEAGVKLKTALDALEKVTKSIDSQLLPKGKAKVLHAAVEMAKRELRSNLPFVATQFSEHVENTVEAAKQEIHGYMTNVVQRAGLEAITNGHLPLQITHKK